ncbi:MAG: tRNA lysidine(34) synthetase TilS [Bacteroidota bacterium]|nr:tRNA lysidine(34) synthetase TilS [Bacteroidota bacterium]
MLTEFNKFVKHHAMFEKHHSLLLALSGGKDSICLFYLLLQSGYSFSVAHCNFQLRGKESDEDQAFVEALAKTHGIKCYVQKFNTSEQMVLLKLSLQETARKLRYDWFRDLINQHGYAKLITAHHLTDNTETFFINLLRNTGISGLHGIPFNSELLVRPLMFADQHQIEAYIKLQEIQFREDKSNQEDNYLRNKIRHHLNPVLETIQPNIHQTVFQVSQNLSSFEKLSQELMLKEWQKISNLKNDVIEINKVELMKLNNATTFLFYMCRNYGFNHEQIEQFLNNELQYGKTILSNTHQMEVQRENIHLFAIKSTVKVDLILEELISELNIQDKTILFELLKQKPEDLKTKNCLLLDYEKIKYPICIRNWQPGDKIKPFGMKGHKKISDILIDKKLNSTEKHDVLVMINQDGKLFAMQPMLISDDFKITDKTTQILSIQVK